VHCGFCIKLINHLATGGLAGPGRVALKRATTVPSYGLRPAIGLLQKATNRWTVWGIVRQGPGVKLPTMVVSPGWCCLWGAGPIESMTTGGLK